MGVYLNSTSPFYLYKSETEKTYFIDKSLLLEQLFPLVKTGNSHICITRPRRFGKTIMANMIGAFFGKGCSADTIFSGSKITQNAEYATHINQYNTIFIDFSEMPEDCNSYQQYIHRIRKNLKDDLCIAYANLNLDPQDAVWDLLRKIFEHAGERFIFVLDEWDCIFHKSFITDTDKQQYISFLSNLLKDRPYVLLSYMTGILPISKYSSGSELNMFLEYTMASEERFSADFGFTESETDLLYDRYTNCTENPQITREGLRFWYDGYQTKSGEKLYNPRSVVAALSNNNLGNYWTSSGPYDEIYYYIENNIDDVRTDLALMISGEKVPAKIREYAATSMNLSTRDEIFSAMVVYGFLSYADGQICIPNKELMDKFDDMLMKESSFGYVYRLAKESARMLSATLAGDTDTMTSILEYAHNTESPLLAYNHETELTAVINLIYLAARDKYRVEREDKAGIGYVDFIFYPYNPKDTCLILELKVDHSADDAIQQIIDRKYALRFLGKTAEKQKYTGDILAVGIGYDRETKKHACKVVKL